MQITDHPSPNFGDRRNGETPDLIVLHYTAMATAALALARLCDPAAEVSAHYLIAPDGVIFRLVAEDRRAWHAGEGGWGGSGDVNSRSVGIELANDGSTPFAARQMDALEGLLTKVMERWNIRAKGVIAHSDMAPSRKGDPGRRFDWRRLSLSGLSVWPDADAGPADDFAQAAIRFGYPDATPSALLNAFRQRFRPWATGSEDATDRALIGDLAARFAIDPVRNSA